MFDVQMKTKSQYKSQGQRGLFGGEFLSEKLHN